MSFEKKPVRDYILFCFDVSIIEMGSLKLFFNIKEIETPIGKLTLFNMYFSLSNTLNKMELIKFELVLISKSDALFSLVKINLLTNTLNEAIGKNKKKLK